MEQLEEYVLQLDHANFIIKEDTAYYRTSRDFKDRIFRLLFSEKEEALELFNALEETNYAQTEKLEIVTLEDAIYNQKVNDLAFQYSAALLSVVEHQSSWSENMPLREMVYLARTYEKILDNRKAYQKKLYQIPTPHLFVLYNGQEERPTETIQYLSEAFLRKEGSLYGQIMVKIININYHKQHPILLRSRTLREYSYFIEEVRGNMRKKGMDRDEAIRHAIWSCTGKGILKSFLEQHGSEVENMLTLYLTEEEFIDIRAEEKAEELVEERAEKLVEERAKKLVEERAEKLAEERAEEKEREIVCNIARSGMIPAKIVEMTGIPEATVKRYLE